MDKNRKNKLLIRRSNVPGKIPSPGDLMLGELALNTADVVLYTSGTTSDSILPIGWDRINRSGDTMDGDLTLNGGLIFNNLTTGTSVNNLGVDSNGNIIIGSSSDTIFTSDGQLTSNRVLDTDGKDLKFVDNVNNATIFNYTEVSGFRALNLGGNIDGTEPVFISKIYGSSRVWLDNGTGESIRLEPNALRLTTQNIMQLFANDGIEFESNEEFVFSNDNDDDTIRGVKYLSDYTLGWDGTTPDEFIPTKGYVDRAINSGVTASNGLNEVNGDIKLGGELTQDTTISLSGNNISTIGTGNESILFDNTDELLVNNIANIEFNFGTQFTVANGFNDIGFEANNTIQLTTNNTINIKNTSFLINQRGMYYDTDYSTEWDSGTEDNVIASKGYVDREIAANSGGSSDSSNKIMSWFFNVT